MTKNSKLFPDYPEDAQYRSSAGVGDRCWVEVWCGDRAESICWSPALTRGQRQQGGRDTVHCSHTWVHILTQQVDKNHATLNKDLKTDNHLQPRIQ